MTQQTVRDTTTPAMPSSTVTTIAYMALALTWGSSFLLMKVALQEFTPAQVALGRILVGATTLTTLMVATRHTWPRERRLWGHMAVVSVFLCVVPFLLFAWAESIPPSGIGAILNSTTPIWTAVAMTAIIRGNRLTRGQLAGISLGAVGVLLIMGALGSGVAYVWNTRVVITWGSLVASTVTYLTPVVGVVLGIAVLGETMTWHEPLGAVVVIVSVMLVQKRIPAVWRRTPR